jgi:hypothetical protein
MGGNAGQDADFEGTSEGQRVITSTCFCIHPGCKIIFSQIHCSLRHNYSLLPIQIRV